MIHENGVHVLLFCLLFLQTLICHSYSLHCSVRGGTNAPHTTTTPIAVTFIQVTLYQRNNILHPTFTHYLVMLILNRVAVHGHRHCILYHYTTPALSKLCYKGLLIILSENVRAD